MRLKPMTGRPKGYKLSEEARASFAQKMHERAEQRRAKKEGIKALAQDPRAQVCTVPDMRSIEKSRSIRSRLNALHLQTDGMLRDLVALRRSIEQLVLEEG